MSARLRLNLSDGRPLHWHCAMMRCASVVTLMVMVLATVACAPVIISVYRPSASEGEVLNAHCPHEPRAVIRFERSGVLVSVWTSSYAFYPPRDEIRVLIVFEVPQGKVVRLSNGVVEISVPSDSISKADLSGPVRPGAPMVGDTTPPQSPRTWRLPYDPPQQWRALTHNASFGFTAFLPRPTSQTSVLKLPKFLVNDVEAELPLITLTRQTDWYIAGMNC